MKFFKVRTQQMTVLVFLGQLMVSTVLTLVQGLSAPVMGWNPNKAQRRNKVSLILVRKKITSADTSQ